MCVCVCVCCCLLCCCCCCLLFGLLLIILMSVQIYYLSIITICLVKLLLINTVAVAKLLQKMIQTSKQQQNKKTEMCKYGIFLTAAKKEKGCRHYGSNAIYILLISDSSIQFLFSYTIIFKCNYHKQSWII